MRLFLISAAALFVLFGAYSPASAAAGQALAKKPVYGQAHALVEKAGWRKRRWRWRRWYRPRVYGYYRRPYRYRRWRWRRRYYRPRVYGYYYRPYRYRRWRWRRRWW